MTALAEIFRDAVLNGSLLLALPVALIAGAISFASPCVLPLIPGYVGYLGGMTAAVQPTGRVAATTRAGSQRGQRQLLTGVLLFVGGFSAVFLLLGVVFGWLGVALAPWMSMIARVLGVVVIIMGLAFLGAIPFLQHDRRLRTSPRGGMWGALVLGVVFGIGWAPCIGPTLSAVLLLSLDGANPVRGGILATVYCLGLGVPFVLLAMAYTRSTRAFSFLQRHRRTITRLGGILLVALGLALVTGLWDIFATWTQGLIADFAVIV